MSSASQSIGQFHRGVWIAGAIGFASFLAWSFALGLLIGSWVGACNDFWAGGHFGFTLIAAIPLAVACALTWGRRVVGMHLRRLACVFLAFLLSLIAFKLTMRPGLEPWFLISDFVVLSLGPVLAFSAAAVIWNVAIANRKSDEQSDARKSPVGRDFES